MGQRDELLSDEDTWHEVAATAEELYAMYLDLNEIDLTTLKHDQAGPPDMNPNWDVPTGIQVYEKPLYTDLGGTSR